MDKKKIILSIIGVAALIVPVILLIIFTKKTTSAPNVSEESRNIDPRTVGDVVGRIPTPEPLLTLPSPSPATSEANEELEGSPSAQ